MEKRLLAIVSLEASSTPARIAADIPGILGTLRLLSKTPPEIAFRSGDGHLFGCFILSNTPVDLAAAKLEASLGLTNRDAIMMVALGDDAAARCGFTRALTWLQRHRERPSNQDG